MNAAMNRSAPIASDAARAALAGCALLMAAVFGTPASAQVYIDQTSARPARDNSIGRTVDQVTRNAMESDAVIASGSVQPAMGSAVTTAQPNINRVELLQTGDRNNASILLSGQDNRLFILQSGAANNATTPSAIGGRGNDLTLRQTGKDNEFGLSLNGISSADNKVDFNQQGNGNRSSLSVLGRENSVRQTQVGDNLSQSISRIGNGGSVTIQQFSLTK